MIFKVVSSLVFVSLILWSNASFAYIDPGTGSILIQGLIGAIAAIGVTLKLYWHRIARFFRRSSPNDITNQVQASDNSSSADKE